MRVLYIHQYFSTRAGAAGTRSYEFARALIQSGHEVTMLCGLTGRSQTGLEGPFSKGRRKGIVDGIAVLEFDISYSNADSIITRARKFLAFACATIGVALRERYDVLFATSTPLTVVLPGVAARLLRGKPFVFEVRDLWPELPKAMGMSNPFALAAMHVLEWLGYKSATRLVALAPGIRSGIERLGIPRDRIALIPNGCDEELFGDGAVSSRQELLDGVLKPSDFLAVFAGAHGLANGLDAVLNAAEVLKHHDRSDIKILLVGDGMCKSALVADARRRGLDNVLFYPPMPKQKLAVLMRSVDMGLQILDDVPAFYNGTSPNKFFDYIAAGKPVLINYPGWLAKYVTEEKCGIAVPAREPGAFAAALTWAADNRQELAVMGERAQAFGRREFNRKALAERFVSTLEQAAGVAKGGKAGC